MDYISTNKNSPPVDFRTVTILGQAPDKGLYFPNEIPIIDHDLLKNIRQISKEEIAFRIIQPYVGDSIPKEFLRRIVEETIDFPFPLVKINEDIFSLELFHGPTLAFKDVGARFMSRCLGYFLKEKEEDVVVLVATSGDTGGAVASGFDNVDGVKVVILYPSGKVSELQELQLTTSGNNITALEVNGTFDDCQKLVKDAFSDEELRKKLFLTSANSINVARWLPQQFYYFFAQQQWDFEELPVISVPSGNFGNICAGLLARHSGLPVKHFIAACNANDVIPAFLQSGNYVPKKAVATLSNAMDVGDPSNFVRILELFNHHFSDLKKILTAYSISDEETRATIRKVFLQTKYILDPHGAVGYAALEKYLNNYRQEKGLFLETAHPAKFINTVESEISVRVPFPAEVGHLFQKKKKSILIEAEYEELKSVLMKRTS